MKSPFDDLEIDKALVCEFFATFMRFEYAMKETSYCSAGAYDIARPDWKKFKSDFGDLVVEGDGCSKDIAYLVEKPPEIQQYVDGRLRFSAVPLDGDSFGARAIEAAKRVRNNLFHGGKHTRYSPPERDERLIRAALSVLEICLEHDPALRAEFEHQLA